MKKILMSLFGHKNEIKKTKWLFSVEDDTSDLNELQKKAILDYPVGTKYRSMEYDTIGESSGSFQYFDNPPQIMSFSKNFDKITIYLNHRWAVRVNES